MTDERLQFVARRLAGEPMAELCREFGISRKTGYKIFDRYQECGVQGLTDRSRRPYRYANKLPFPVARKQHCRLLPQQRYLKRRRRRSDRATRYWVCPSTRCKSRKLSRGWKNGSGTGVGVISSR